MVWTGKQYFSVRVTKNAMSAFVPKGTGIDPDTPKMSYEIFLDFLKHQHGVLLDPPVKVFEEFTSAAKHNPYGFKQNFELIAGQPPKEGKPGSLTTIPREGVPSDMALEGLPFMQYTPAIPAQDGYNVHNEIFPAPKLFDPLSELILPTELDMDEQGRIIPSASGQVEMKGSTLVFRPLYRIEDPTEPHLQNAELHCNIWIDSDLSGSMSWKIYGNLLVEGHLSAGNLEVYGDLEVKQGIQTNNEGTLRVFGNVKTGYLQMTRMGVEGNLVVDRGILQCELRVGGNIKCLGVPGAIQGSKIFCLSAVQANRAGSDAGVETHLDLPYLDTTLRIRVGLVSQGTKFSFQGKTWTAASKSSFSSQQGDD